MRLAYKIILFCLLFSGLAKAQAKNIFVSPSGKDSNDGLTAGSPKQSINSAINSAAAGDTVYLLPGTYKEIIKFISRNGLPEKAICLYGYFNGAGQQPVIDGGAAVPSNLASNYWIQIQNSSWIEIGNIIFQNGWTNPIQISNSSYLTFTGCTFYGGKRVINASGSGTHHLLVEKCFWDQGGDYLWKLVTDANGTDAWTSMHEGLMQYYNGSLINFSGTGGSIVIRNNTIENAFNGIRWTAQKGYDSNVEIYGNVIRNIRDNDFEPEYYTYNLHIYHNRSHNIHKTLSVDHVNGGYIYYYGNLITSDKDSWSNSIATSFWKVYGDASGNLSYPMYAFNNSFCGVGKAFAMDQNTTAKNLKHFNNAYYFTGNRGWMLDYWDSSNEFDYDISNKDWASNLKNNSQEIHGKYTDVMFADVQNFDLRLQANSPAVDAGKLISFPEFGWTQSFDGAAPDIGAYEGDRLVEGPAFRFIDSAELKISYKEKPRIVRENAAGSMLRLYFSAPVDPSSISALNIMLYERDSLLKIIDVSLLNENYEMDIETQSQISDSLLTLGFFHLPKGMNGEDATLWAAALNVDRSRVVTGVKLSGANTKAEDLPALNIYPNPFNSQAKISVELPASLSGIKNIYLKIYDILGREIKEIKFFPSGGRLEYALNGNELPSGVYFAVLNFGSQFISKKIILLK